MASPSSHMSWFMLFTLVTALVAGVMLLAAVGAALWKMRTATLRPLREPPRDTQACGRPGCGCTNPAPARYCRRCGETLQADDAPAIALPAALSQ